MLNLTEKILSDFGFKDYEVNLSTRSDKSVSTNEGWEYIEDKGGGTFYGPKIDIKIKDAIGRTWQCSTIQVDFNLPGRFDMEYVAADGSRQRPIMIHRAIFGSLERFYGILIKLCRGFSLVASTDTGSFATSE